MRATCKRLRCNLEVAPRLGRAGSCARTSSPTTGQDFSDNAQQHPDGTLASNLVPVTRADPAAPDVIEFREEMSAAVDRLMANSILRDELVRSDEVRKG